MYSNLKTRDEIIQWFEKLKKLQDNKSYSYIINDDLSVDIKGDFKVSDIEITLIPFKIRYCFGTFQLYNTRIKTMSNFPDEVYGEYFNCSKGRLETLTFCPKCKICDLSENKISKINEIPQCEALILSHNNISEIPEEMSGAKLKLLDLSHNNIREITNIPLGLEVFRIGHNELKSLKNFPNVKIFEISNILFNDISTLEFLPSSVLSNDNLVDLAFNMGDKSWCMINFKEYPQFENYDGISSQLKRIITIYIDFIMFRKNRKVIFDEITRLYSEIEDNYEKNKISKFIRTVKNDIKRLSKNILRDDTINESHFKSYTKDEIEKWLKKYDVKNYIISEDLSVTCEGDVSLKNMTEKMIPIKFKKIVGDFYVRESGVTTMKNFPDECDGCDISHSKGLKSLEFAPKCDVFKAINCDISIIDFYPKCEHLDLSKNKIEAFPQSNEKQKYKTLIMDNNLISSLENIPKISEYVSLKNNKLTSLRFLPKISSVKVERVSGNPLKSLKGLDTSNWGYIDVYKCMYSFPNLIYSQCDLPFQSIVSDLKNHNPNEKYGEEFNFINNVILYFRFLSGERDFFNERHLNFMSNATYLLDEEKNFMINARKDIENIIRNENESK